MMGGVRGGVLTPGGNGFGLSVGSGGAVLTGVAVVVAIFGGDAEGLDVGGVVAAGVDFAIMGGDGVFAGVAVSAAVFGGGV
jgi:hypothetical protein